MTISETMLGYTTALYAAKADISMKKEQIIELNMCRKEVKAARASLTEANRNITLPELTSKTWFGQLADTFDDIRNEMKLAGKELRVTQLTNVLDRIDEKITELKSEIHSLENEGHLIQRKIHKEKQKLLNLKSGK
ncbi:DUF5082 family protein [Bacillus safensis]|uniref:YwqH-like family protein n=1 Tax=Bacillus safensis TaxID=561879 RepID=UPI002FFD6420